MIAEVESRRALWVVSARAVCRGDAEGAMYSVCMKGSLDRYSSAPPFPLALHAGGQGCKCAAGCRAAGKGAGQSPPCTWGCRGRPAEGRGAETPKGRWHITAPGKRCCCFFSPSH